MRCEHCGFISFEHNNNCPSCGADLSSLRRRMNIYWDRPDTDFHKLFAMAPETDVEFVNAGQTAPDEEDTELDFDADDDFEFSLDD